MHGGIIIPVLDFTGLVVTRNRGKLKYYRSHTMNRLHLTILLKWSSVYLSSSLFLMTTNLKCTVYH